MRFNVETVGSIGNINPTVPHVIISISDTVAERAEPATNDKTLDVLFLAFHDADKPGIGVDLISPVHVNQILNFYLRYRDEAELFIAHCIAGQCRSPAVIAALQKIETGNDDIWFRTKTPNRLVYRMILEAAYERGLIS